MHNNDNHRSARRRAIMLAVTAGIALLTTAAACGGGSSTGSAGSSATGASTTYAKELAYAQCMRSHGVPNFPDPNSNGTFSINGNSVNLHSAQAQSAQKACSSLAPHFTQAQQAQASSQMLKYSQCMRSHGVPNFPDPNSKGQISQSFKKGSGGVNPQSPQYQSAQRDCRSLMPGAPGGSAP
jgi:hypothetical protein